MPALAPLAGVRQAPVAASPSARAKALDVAHEAGFESVHGAHRGLSWHTSRVASSLLVPSIFSTTTGGRIMTAAEHSIVPGWWVDLYYIVALPAALTALIVFVFLVWDRWLADWWAARKKSQAPKRAAKLVARWRLAQEWRADVPTLIVLLARHWGLFLFGVVMWAAGSIWAEVVVVGSLFVHDLSLRNAAEAPPAILGSKLGLRIIILFTVGLFLMIVGNIMFMQHAWRLTRFWDVLTPRKQISDRIANILGRGGLTRLEIDEFLTDHGLGTDRKEKR